VQIVIQELSVSCEVLLAVRFTLTSSGLSCQVVKHVLQPSLKVEVNVFPEHCYLSTRLHSVTSQDTVMSLNLT
jgi:hypothetical protein